MAQVFKSYGREFLDTPGGNAVAVYGQDDLVFISKFYGTELNGVEVIFDNISDDIQFSEGDNAWLIYSTTFSSFSDVATLVNNDSQFPFTVNATSATFTAGDTTFSNGTNSDDIMYTAPAGTTAIVIGCQAANLKDTVETLNVWWDRSGDRTWLAKSVEVPENASYEPIAGKLVLEPGDKLKSTCADAESVSFSITVLELS